MRGLILEEQMPVKRNVAFLIQNEDLEQAPHTVTSRIIPKGGKRNLLQGRCVASSSLHRVCSKLLANELANSICGGSGEGYTRERSGVVALLVQWVFWQSKLGLGEFSPFGI